MSDYIIERRLWLPRPRPDVFAFFVDPRNLGAVQPTWAQPTWLADARSGSHVRGALSAGETASPPVAVATVGRLVCRGAGVHP